MMTPRERFIKALRREPIQGHVPHFELVMFLTMEAIGRIHPLHRDYSQWYQMSAAERRLHLVDMAKAYIETAEKYHHSAIFVHPNPGPNGEMPDDIESTRAILETIRELSGDKFFLMIHGDPTYPIPTGDTMMEFSTMMYEEPEKIHGEDPRRHQAEGGVRPEAVRRDAQAPRPAGRLGPLLRLLLQRQPLLQPGYVRRVRPALPEGDSGLLPGQRLLLHQAHRRQRDAHSGHDRGLRPRRRTAAPTPSTPWTPRAAWIWRRPSGSTATGCASSAT